MKPIGLKTISNKQGIITFHTPQYPTAIHPLAEYCTGCIYLKSTKWNEIVGRNQVPKCKTTLELSPTTLSRAVYSRIKLALDNDPMQKLQLVNAIINETLLPRNFELAGFIWNLQFVIDLITHRSTRVMNFE